jgi:L-ascorbate metabolism protein UlaG (beta-lactamase superfamily)
VVRFLKLKWLGHASWKIKAGGKTIYLDPYEGEYDEVADLVLASHSHQDHCHVQKTNMIKSDKTIIIAPEDCANILGTKVKSLKPGQTASFNGVTIEAVEAYNYKRFRSPGVPFHPRGLGVGYIVKAEGKSVYHTGDTDFIDEMKELTGLDLVLIVSGGTYTMDNDDAADAVLAMKPKMAIPQHMWDTNPRAFKEKIESNSDVTVKILEPNETLTL